MNFEYSTDILEINKFLNIFHFRCGMTHLNFPLKKLGKTFKLHKDLLKTEMNHVEVDGNNYKDKKR